MLQVAKTDLTLVTPLARQPWSLLQLPAFKSAVGWCNSNGQTVDTIWAAARDWQPGHELSLYNSYSSKAHSTANILSIEARANETAVQSLNNALTGAGLHSIGRDQMRLIRLDRPVPIGSLSMLGSKQLRTERSNRTDAYFRDGSNNGIAAKGKSDVLLAHHQINDTSLAASAVRKDVWWGGGFTPGRLSFAYNIACAHTCSGTSHCLLLADRLWAMKQEVQGTIASMTPAC